MTSKARTLGIMWRSMKNPLTYLVDYFGLTSKKLVRYKLRNGVEYDIRTKATDRFIVNEVWFHRSYTPRGFEIKPKDIVVDIGAHAGIFTCMAAYYACDGEVHAFEPVPHNFRLLQHNVALNKYAHVRTHNMAVAAKKGALELFVSQAKNKGQNSMVRLHDDQKPVKVPTTTLKELLKKLKKIDFLKVDCEGAEYAILPSLSNAEFAKIDKISMEYHNYDGHNGGEIKTLLEENGFKVQLIPDGKMFGTIYAKRS